MMDFPDRDQSRLPSLSPRVLLASSGVAAFLLLGTLLMWHLGDGVSEAPPQAATIVPTFEARLAEAVARAEAELDGSQAQLDLARLLHDAHRHDEAAQLLRRYLDAAPGDRQAWLDLANLLGAIERWDEALAASRALLELFPGDPAALYNLGAIAANMEEYDEARTWWERLLIVGGDEGLVEQATASLARLDALAAGATPAISGGLPPGHPPITTSSRPVPPSFEYVQARDPRVSR